VSPVVREELGRAPKPHSPFWFEAGSAFRNKLAGLLTDIDVEFREFTWSGSNSFQARTFASDALREYLNPELARPQTQHVLIGHSHAGNVIFEALAGPDPIVDAERLAGVLSLATPYLAMETETDDFNLLLHGLLPLILGGYALALIVFNAAFGHWDTAGWMAASAVAYVTGFARLRPQSGWRWPREFVFWAAAILSAGCVGHAVLPWFTTNYPAGSLYGIVFKYAALPAACLLGVANLALSIAARAAGSTPPGTYLLRDLVHALAAVYASVVLLVASVWFMFDQTTGAAWFWVVLSIWPFAALGIAASGNGTRLRTRAIDLWRKRAKEFEQVTLPCEIHAMRLPSDEASLAIVASQLVRATTASPRQVLEWVISWRTPAATLVAVTLVLFGASIGYVQFAGLASGWIRFVVGGFSGWVKWRSSRLPRRC
jgi:hypothetical protein